MTSVYFLSAGLSSKVEYWPLANFRPASCYFLKDFSMHFRDFGLEPRLVENIGSLGYLTPTPIQLKAIPETLKGGDVVGLAETGSGKTAAFVLPILQSLLRSERSSSPRALVLAPTRELVDQIYQSFRELGRKTGLSGVTLYGGAPIGPQLRALSRGVDVVVACPGRLLDHLERKSVNFSQLQVLVLDEADHMFDMGFLPTVRRIKKHLPVKRQTLLFTATMPDEVRRITTELVSKPITVQVGSSGLSKTVSHSMYSVSDSCKNGLLIELMKGRSEGSTIVFTRTKRRAKKLSEVLLGVGASVTALQGNLSQTRRRDAIDGFRSGKYQILVATDIAARGIDVSQVTRVVNYDMPDTVEAYTHRTGRTGRALRSGNAVSFISPGDNSILHRIQRDLRLKITQCVLPEGVQSSSTSLAHSEQRAPRRSSYDKPRKAFGRAGQRRSRAFGQQELTSMPFSGS